MTTLATRAAALVREIRERHVSVVRYARSGPDRGAAIGHECACMANLPCAAIRAADLLDEVPWREMEEWVKCKKSWDEEKRWKGLADAERALLAALTKEPK